MEETRRGHGAAEWAAAPPHGAAESPPKERTLEEALYESLLEVENWAQVVRVLHEQLGLTKAEIARAAGVAPHTVNRWLDSVDGGKIRTHQGLDDLRYVVLTLLSDGAMRAPLLRFWLISKNADLRTDPLTAIARGRFEETIASGRAFIRARRL